MQATPLGGDRLAGVFAGFVTELVDFLAATTERDDHGYPAPTWAAVSGLTDIEAAIGAEDVQQDQLQAGGSMVREVVAVRVHLNGVYAITTAMRMLWNAEQWRITHVFPDPAQTFTVFSAERVTPSV